jgi:hypothetical protein
MTIEELKEYLREKLNFDAVCFGTGHPIEDDGKYHIVKRGTGWIVYFVERSVVAAYTEFGQEADACAHLISLLRADATTWRNPGAI